MTNIAQINVHEVETAPVTVERLVDLAIAGLPQMFDPDRQLFCYRMVKTRNGLVREGISHRYTLITLMGLHRLEQSGRTSPIPIQPVLERLLAETAWIDNLGDLGLLLWLCALTAPHRLHELAGRLRVDSALERYDEARQGQTMELAWFLTGVSHWALALPQQRALRQDLALSAYRILHRNLAPCGAWGHMARGRTLAGHLRWWMGSFADQVYPIYALTRFAQAWPNPEAQQNALETAGAICQAQGHRGQWWWHYDASNGAKVEVVDAYPVFSVHQHGMAPMVLLETGEAFQQDFTPWINKGLEWLDGRNELNFDMRERSVIWRSIERTSMKRYWESFFNRAASGDEHPSRDLNLRFECRPYELGWLLYAWARRIAA